MKSFQRDWQLNSLTCRAWFLYPLIFLSLGKVCRRCSSGRAVSKQFWFVYYHVVQFFNYCFVINIMSDACCWTVCVNKLWWTRKYIPDSGIGADLCSMLLKAILCLSQFVPAKYNGTRYLSFLASSVTAFCLCHLIYSCRLYAVVLLTFTWNVSCCNTEKRSISSYLCCIYRNWCS